VIGAFETLWVSDGTPFAWQRHIDRLRFSAAELGIAVPETRLREAVDAVLAANELREARVRITVTDEPGLYVVATPVEPAAPIVDVVIAPWSHNQFGALVGLKTISYAANVRGLVYALEQHADEAVFANARGDLCEATTANIFVVQYGVVRTPPLSAGCLPGVTRALLLEIAHDLQIPAEETDIPIDALATADEAFLSGSVRGVQAIAHVDGEPLRAAPGPITTQLRDRLSRVVGG
jgi:branched-chain amino acid aminotransferase